MLLPGLLIILLSRMDLFRSDVTWSVRWESGVLRAAGDELGPERTEGELAPGDWCISLGEVEAELLTGNVTLELGPDTSLMLEDPREGRLRLQQGELLLEGDSVVTSPYGVVQVEEGSARLIARDGQLSLECLAGHASITNRDGVERLVQGERAVAGLTGVVVQSR